MSRIIEVEENEDETFQLFFFKNSKKKKKWKEMVERTYQDKFSWSRCSILHILQCNSRFELNNCKLKKMKMNIFNFFPRLTLYTNKVKATIFRYMLKKKPLIKHDKLFRWWWWWWWWWWICWDVIGGINRCTKDKKNKWVRRHCRNCCRKQRS